MKINIRSEKVLVTDSIRDYITDKLNKLTKYFENATDITAKVVIKIVGRNQTIEVTIPTTFFTLRNEETNPDLYAAIDLVIDKLERQIRKNKTKMQNKALTKKALDFNLDYIEDDEDNEEDSKIVKRKKIEMKPMNELEAVLQMNMVGHDFFIYKDDKSSNICVLYKRKDGNYGVIETR